MRFNIGFLNTVHEFEYRPRSWYTFEQLYHDFFYVDEATRGTTRSTLVWGLTVDYMVPGDGVLKANVVDYTANDSVITFRLSVGGSVVRKNPSRSTPFDPVLVNRLSEIKEMVVRNTQETSTMIGNSLRRNGPMVRRAPRRTFLNSTSITPLVAIALLRDVAAAVPEGIREDVKVCMSKKAFNALPLVVPEDGAVCCICQDGILNEKVKEFKCKHEFHTDCIGGWLLNESVKCPVCREELHTSDSDKVLKNAGMDEPEEDGGGEFDDEPLAWREMARLLTESTQIPGRSLF